LDKKKLSDIRIIIACSRSYLIDMYRRESPFRVL